MLSKIAHNNLYQPQISPKPITVKSPQSALAFKGDKPTSQENNKATSINSNMILAGVVAALAALTMVLKPNEAPNLIDWTRNGFSNEPKPELKAELNSRIDEIEKRTLDAATGLPKLHSHDTVQFTVPVGSSANHIMNKGNQLCDTEVPYAQEFSPSLITAGRVGDKNTFIVEGSCLGQDRQQELQQGLNTAKPTIEQAVTASNLPPVGQLNIISAEGTATAEDIIETGRDGCLTQNPSLQQAEFVPETIVRTAKNEFNTQGTCYGN